MTKTTQKWDNRFLDLAQHVATWSKDPSTQVGCVLVNQERVVVGLGYNGFPRGVCDHAERLEDRDTKYQMVQHAETNAVLNASASVKGCTAYVTHAPCANCTGILIQAGINRIVTLPTPAGLAERFAESYKISTQMLNEAKIPLEFMPPSAT